MTVRPLAMVTKVGRRVLVALGEVLVLGKVLVLVRVRLAKVRVVICGSVVIALGKVLVIGSLGILTLRPLAKVVILALQSLQRRRRKRKNNEQMTLGKIRRTRGQLISKEKEFRPLAMVRRTQPGAENAAGDAAKNGTNMLKRTKHINGWNENCQRPVKSPQNGKSKRGSWLTRMKSKQHGYILTRRKPRKSSTRMCWRKMPRMPGKHFAMRLRQETTRRRIG